MQHVIIHLREKITNEWVEGHESRSNAVWDPFPRTYQPELNETLLNTGTTDRRCNGRPEDGVGLVRLFDYHLVNEVDFAIGTSNGKEDFPFFVHKMSNKQRVYILWFFVRCAASDKLSCNPIISNPKFKFPNYFLSSN